MEQQKSDFFDRALLLMGGLLVSGISAFLLGFSDLNSAFNILGISVLVSGVVFGAIYVGRRSYLSGFVEFRVRSCLYGSVCGFILVMGELGIPGYWLSLWNNASPFQWISLGAVLSASLIFGMFSAALFHFLSMKVNKSIG